MENFDIRANDILDDAFNKTLDAFNDDELASCMNSDDMEITTMDEFKNNIRDLREKVFELEIDILEIKRNLLKQKGEILDKNRLLDQRIERTQKRCENQDCILYGLTIISGLVLGAIIGKLKR